ncbi:ParA family protein [Paenibacillus mucilaginosus]|uniref:Partition protein/ATPase n=4 Tax=Paenibacillus mucilaginosus TaxID=61624 RepID=I0BAW5_9BACL|nr:ParA family protein [Paenibacillus mucilaginosus]AEI39074.1 putative partition protein/ATPase [Paenibacillus mucilaginosus KNP414]AFC27369.1 putative partition protein/ATPase [Paenibacillus mucilaginosus 3016]AFH59512.1 partition protein/ATPase [Paenibacillus mucilaginosus K02]MCG7216203.1 ParA family protein [Paenibacillus mucilaginosus]WDM28103.1 ParA family protein [Paenibacillus mucilaginosus]
MGNVIAVCMNKGGVGKTTLVTHLAAVLASGADPAKVLVVDIDPQGNAAVVFGRDPDRLERGSTADVLLRGTPLADITVPVSDHLDLAPASDELNGSEVQVLGQPGRYARPLHLLKEAVGRVKKEYDWILIDCPPSLGLLTANAVKAADGVLVPFVPEAFSVKGLQRVVQAIEGLRDEGSPSPRIVGVAATMVDSRSTLHGELLASARAYCAAQGFPMLETVIPRSIRYANAAAYEGRPAVWSDRSHPAVAPYFELTKEVLAHAVPKKRTAR